MNLCYITIFPELIINFFKYGVIKRAVDGGLINFTALNLRDFAQDQHKTVDDYPYGDSPGMLLKPEPLSRAIIKASEIFPSNKVLVLSAAGIPFSSSFAKKLSQEAGLTFICGRYEGIDERVTSIFAHFEVSIGPYVVCGGELPALVVTESILRYRKGVLGNEQSIEGESFSDMFEGEPARFTRPEHFFGLKVPDYLLSGNHQSILIEDRKRGSGKQSQNYRSPWNNTQA
ncbi:MAG: tRNA (guanosine(37)-N1)-methyltransferase TrmD [Deltaproteobacteria bacterium]|nr:tRNA (guanosine(37)-N1)-methyltransferase TrmD [Deltaproteobacteria bacterium]